MAEGACEGGGVEKATVGGVMLNLPNGEPRGLGRTRCLRPEWKRRRGKQTIGQAELLPFFAAKLTWEKRLRERKVIYFQDNDSARDGLIRASSQSVSSMNLIAVFC